MIENSSGLKDFLTKMIRPQFETTFNVICFKDSRDVTDEIRMKLVRAIEDSPHKKFVITHGTYTMSETAEFLKKNLKSLDDRTIVLTGSMIPLHGFSETDAPFNLGFAISGAMFHEPGIFLAMNGELFASGHVRKNLDEGKFEEI